MPLIVRFVRPGFPMDHAADFFGGFTAEDGFTTELADAGRNVFNQ